MGIVLEYEVTDLLTFGDQSKEKATNAQIKFVNPWPTFFIVL
jgi:hypothetical protein